MEFLGEIVCDPEKPALEKRRWIELIGMHPNLIRPPDRETINPFTKKPMTMKSREDHARVTLDGRDVVAMSWSEDDSILINVFGETGAVVPLANAIADILGGRFEAYPGST